MHETSLMAGLLRKVVSVVDRAGAARAVRVSVRLGALSHFSVEHFREHFVRSAAGTPAEGAALEVDVSEDMDDPDAQAVLLRSVEVEGDAG
jgi:hydrogenase nickel incorporation protein HypA/HybF